MRRALARAALAGPSASTAPRSAFLATTRFSSTDSTPPTKIPQARPYVVGVTNSNSYPVYNSTKAARSYKLTLIKKIDGNRKALIQDLADAIGVPKENMKINPVTRHVEVKGHHIEKIKEFLTKTLGDPKVPKTALTEITA